MDGNLAREIRDLRSELAEFKRAVGVQYAKLSGDLTAIRHLLDTKITTRSDLAPLYALAEKALVEIEASRNERVLYSRGYMRHEDKLADIERRILGLEQRGS